MKATSNALTVVTFSEAWPFGAVLAVRAKKQFRISPDRAQPHVPWVTVLREKHCPWQQFLRDMDSAVLASPGAMTIAAVPFRQNAVVIGIECAKPHRCNSTGMMRLRRELSLVARAPPAGERAARAGCAMSSSTSAKNRQCTGRVGSLPA